MLIEIKTEYVTSFHLLIIYIKIASNCLLRNVYFTVNFFHEKKITRTSNYTITFLLEEIL